MKLVILDMMKIDYKNYPILKSLSENSLGMMPVYEVDKFFFDCFGHRFVDLFKKNCSEFKKEINVMSKSFCEAAIKSTSKLEPLVDDIINNNIDDIIIKGCHVMGEFVCLSNIEIRKNCELYDACFFVFTKDGTPILMDYRNKDNCDDDLLWISNDTACVQGKRDISSEDISTFAQILMKQVIVFYMFKSYAQVETKILHPKQKVMDIICKYKNDTKLKLTFLDSKWFTNLVKSDGFNVRGHFRLQPKKVDGKMSKELIWIADFQKTGYTAPARILATNNQI